MYLNKEKTKEVITKFGKNESDTGAPEAQIALFTERINHLTKHLKENKKDFSTQRSLYKMVGKRRQQLNYLKHKDIYKYRELIAELKLRR